MYQSFWEKEECDRDSSLSGVWNVFWVPNKNPPVALGNSQIQMLNLPFKIFGFILHFKVDIEMVNSVVPFVFPRDVIRIFLLSVIVYTANISFSSYQRNSFFSKDALDIEVLCLSAEKVKVRKNVSSRIILQWLKVSHL